VIDIERLKTWLPERRWFGGKGHTIDSIEIVDQTVVEEGDPALVIALLRVHSAGQDPELYHAPLMIPSDGEAWDPFDDPARLGQLGSLMAHGESLKGDFGVFHFGGPGLDPLSPPGSESTRTLGVEQSNSSVVLDEKVILKLFRRPGVGPNPDLELNRLLTNEGFREVPAQVGEILYEGTLEGEDIQIDLGIAQEFIHDGIEGWESTLREVRALYDQIHEEDAKEDLKFLTEQRAADILDSLAELGDATGGLHIVLSREEIDPELAPEEIEVEDLATWTRSARTTLRKLIDSGMDELVPLKDAIEERIAAVEQVQHPGFKTRIQGDYHLAQVMHTPRGWVLLDFEGEPARPLEERREKQSPLRDVAGMLRSFSYAATAVLFERAEPESEEWLRLEPWSNCWEKVARERFLNSYLARSHEGRFLPAERDDIFVLLDFFEIDKALYELGYERSNRPDWIRIPLRGIRDTVARGTT
jgi:trehalose synthase-fused probable maltokinase